MNYLAVDKGIEALKKIDVPADWGKAKDEAAATRDVPAFISNIQEPVNGQRGDKLPVSTFVGMEDGIGELMYDFYNKTGERARIVLLDTGLRFETSAFTLDEGDETATPAREAVAAVAKGCVAHFDKTAKKFIISAAATPHADYDNAANQFLVVATEDDTDAIDGIDVIRLEVIK
jgi:hypothetical protein